MAMETCAPRRDSHSRAASGKSDPMSPICRITPDIHTIRIIGGPSAMRCQPTSGSTHVPVSFHTLHNSAEVNAAQTRGIAISHGHPLAPPWRAR